MSTLVLVGIVVGVSGMVIGFVSMILALLNLKKAGSLEGMMESSSIIGRHLMCGIGMVVGVFCFLSGAICVALHFLL